MKGHRTKKLSEKDNSLTNVRLMHQSIPAAPIPPRATAGPFVHHVSPGGRALANLARPKYGGFYRKGLAVWQIGLSVKVKNWKNLWRFSRFYALISSLLNKAQLEQSTVFII